MVYRPARGEWLKRALRIGLTGGIGSGKSVVADFFRLLRVPVLDLDQVGHDVAAPESAGLAQLIDTLGKGILSADGSLNRRALASLCFSSAKKTEKLNTIMHPLIWQAEEQWLARQQTPYVIVEASVLLESGGMVRMDGVIVVMADLALRLQRVLTRGDRNAQQFQTIVARQCGDDLRRSSATYIIDNNSSLQELEVKVSQIHRQILAKVEIN